ncbi:MAG: ABC transporter ATP-binding protein [Eubacteriales bacterium]|nr:ABC transporter ATP-binding protein [Eubacteriales bacterium]
MDILKRIAGLCARYKRVIFAGLLLQTVVIATRMILPFLTKSVVNDVITDGHIELLGKLCAGILALVIIRALCTYVRSVTFEKVSQDVAYDMRVGLYKHLQEMPYEFYDKNRVGEIMSRMTGDLEGVRNLIAGGVITAYDNLFNFIGALIFMSVMCWQMTVLMLIFAPLSALIAWQFRKRVRPVFRAIREQNAVLNTRAQENLAGVRVVKAFAREDYESERFDVDNKEVLNKNLEATWVWSRYVPLMELLSGMCTPVALIGAAVLASLDMMDVGTFVGVTGYIWMISSPMNMLSNIINQVTNATTSAEKLFYYIDLGASIKEPENAKSPEFKGHVVFDHVTFSYGGVTVLKDVSFEAKPGQTIAVMGATGSGKSTLVNLMGRFYDVKKGSGAILVDGVDVREHKLHALRREIGYVPQETFLFSDTLEDNIRFGRPDASHEQVVRAARVAQAEEFIEHMPAKYETIVGERGMGLSGGQKQRVAIARAVLTDPAILVMDDSTSAVDMETEYEIQQQLGEVLHGRTTFIIAHRISSVKNADCILVLDKGEIVERGTHKELLARQGVYWRMVQDQTASFADTMAPAL